MKNTVKSNFSLRKLILTALVAGPVAILPAPLWALPSTAATNLTTSTGVSVVSAGASALNVTSPDKGVLTWVNFGSGTDTIATNDTINYILPSASASVLNLVSGGATTTINGNLVSNGNVYVMNQAGIVIGSGAQINVGGFYASAINEPLAASFFGSTGTLSFTGTGSGSVVVSHTDASKSAPIIQAVGTGNNIVLAGGASGAVVDVQMGQVFGNLTTRSTGGNISLASGGAVSVSGGLTVNSNGGQVDLTKAPTSFSFTSDAGVTSNRLPAASGGVLPTGALTITNAGSGYTPSSTINVTFDAPKVVNNGNTISVFGTSATGQIVTDSTGKVTSFTILTGGSGYSNSAPQISQQYTVTSPSSQGLTVSGALNVNTNGGLVQSASGARMTVGGVASLNTAGTSSFGTVTLPNTDFQSTLNLTNVGTTTITDAVGSLTLGNGTVNAGANAVNSTELTLSASATSGSTISMASGAKIAVVPSTTNTAPRISLSSTSSGITYTGTGTMTFATLSTSTTATATIVGDKDIFMGTPTTTPAYTGTYGGRGLSITTSGGSITTGGITRTDATLTLSTTGLGDINYTTNGLVTSGTVNITAANGKVTIGNPTAASTTAMLVGGSSVIRASSDVAIGSDTFRVGFAAPSGVTIQSTGGQVALSGAFSGSGTISAATNVVLGTADSSAAANISSGTATMNSVNSNGNAAGLLQSYALPSTLANGAGYNPNTNYDITVSGTNLAAGATGATGYATTDANGRIASVTITSPGTVNGSGVGYTTVPAVTLNAAQLPTNSVVASGALSITATNGSITFPSSNNNIVSSSTSALSLTSGQSISLTGNVTAPTLNLTSTAGAVSQTSGAITSNSKATLSAATSISLDPGAANNDFNQIVVTNTPGGATITDRNNIVIAGGTDAKGDLIVKAGQAAGSTAAPTIASPVSLVSTVGNVAGSQNLNAASITISAGGVSAVTLPTSNGYTYAPGATVGLTFTAPPSLQAPNITAAAVFTSTSTTNNTGYVLSNGGLARVAFLGPIGNGYAPNSTLAVTVTDPNGAAVLPVATASVNANGQISSVTITSAGSGLTTPTISFPAPNGGTITPAVGYANVNTNGSLGSVTLTDNGNGYFGVYTPKVTIGTAASALNTATATVNNVLATAATQSINVTSGGANYASAPAVTLSNGATATAVVANGAVTAIYPGPVGQITLGTAATDVIKVAGNLSLQSSSPSGQITTGPNATDRADNSAVTTVANTLTVTGTISATNNGAPVTFGNQAQIGTPTSNTFGGVAASIGTGNLTVNSNAALALVTITAGSLTARSISGDITNTGAITLTNGATLTAKDIFAPGNITLNNAANAIGGTIVVTNAKDFSLTNTVNTTVTAGSASVVGSAMTGLTSVTTSAGKSLTLQTAGGGDFGVVSFNAGGRVDITDPNTVTIRNATNTGTGVVNITAQNGAINLDSGITLNGTGLVTLAAQGANGTITDTASGVFVYGPITLNSSNGISITKAGHSFGAVTLASGLGGAATNADINFVESGTLKLANVSATNSATASASVALSSTTGAIIQSGGAITVTGVTSSTQAATFSAAQGVTLDRTTNIFGGTVSVPVTLTAGADSTINSSGGALTLGNVRVNGGTFTVSTANGAGQTLNSVAQAAGTTAAIFGNTSITTNGAPITLTNSGNNFGALTLASSGADIALTESSTLNINAVNAGGNNKITLVSENGSIIQTATGTGITGAAGVASAISLTAAKGNITLTGTNASGGAPLTFSTNGNLAFTDSSQFTKLASGTSVTGTTNLRNTYGVNGLNVAKLSDISGGLLLNGAVMIDMTGAAGSGDISINGSGNSFGAIQFRANNVTIAEDKTLNVAAGSLATGTTTLSSLADIVTTGAGSSYFSGGSANVTGLTLIAGGNITITNPITVYNGVTFRALGAVDLSALSVAVNLNGKTPTNLGAASYKAPQP